MEILIAAAIAACLVALLVPFVGSAVDRARESRCVSNLRQIGSAVHLYASDHNMNLPPGNQDGILWFNLNSSWLREYGGGGTEQSAKGLLRCPADRTKPPITDYRYYYSYAYNTELLLSYVGGAPANERLPVKISQASQKILFADGISNAEAPGQVAKYPANISASHILDRISRRHHNGASCLFGDGRVVRMLPSEVNVPGFFVRE